jgi:hypothetical protein
MRKLITVVEVYVLGFFPLAASAQLGNTTNFGLDQFGSETNLGTDIPLIETIARIINILLGFLGVLVVVAIVYGGFKRMTAGGNEEQVSEGNKIMTAGLIGLAIVFAAFGIASFVVHQLAQSTNARP